MDERAPEMDRILAEQGKPRIDIRAERNRVDLEPKLNQHTVCMNVTETFNKKVQNFRSFPE